MKVVYEETGSSDRQLRGIVSKAASSHVRELMDRGEFVSLFRIGVDLAIDVLKGLFLPMAPTRKIGYREL